MKGKTLMVYIGTLASLITALVGIITYVDDRIRGAERYIEEQIEDVEGQIKYGTCVDICFDLTDGDIPCTEYCNNVRQ